VSIYIHTVGYATMNTDATMKVEEYHQPTKHIESPIIVFTKERLFMLYKFKCTM